jgi:hypothetical protein
MNKMDMILNRLTAKALMYLILSATSGVQTATVANSTAPAAGTTAAPSNPNNPSSNATGAASNNSLTPQPTIVKRTSANSALRRAAIDLVKYYKSWSLELLT